MNKKRGGVIMEAAQKTADKKRQPTTQEHSISMKTREQMDLTGVLGIESFDNEEFILETTEGILAITGKEMKLNNLDMDKGIMTIKGTINGFTYHDPDAPKKGMFSKMLR